MFFTKLWKLEFGKLRKRLEVVETKFSMMKDAVPEFGTGYLIAKSEAVSRPLVREGCGPVSPRRFGLQVEMYARGGASVSLSPSGPEQELAWFRKNDAPTCDYITLSRDNIVKFMKKQPAVEVDEEGKVVIKKVSNRR